MVDNSVHYPQDVTVGDEAPRFVRECLLEIGTTISLRIPDCAEVVNACINGALGRHTQDVANVLKPGRTHILARISSAEAKSFSTLVGFEAVRFSFSERLICEYSTWIPGSDPTNGNFALRWITGPRVTSGLGFRHT